MKNKIITIVVLTVLTILTISSVNNKVYADPMDIINGQYNAGLENPLENPNSWKPSSPSDDTEFVRRANVIFTVINSVGIVCSVIILVIMGIKYLLGSVEEKAEYKKSILPYIIGIVLLVACTTIPNVIYHMSTTIFK